MISSDRSMLVLSPQFSLQKLTEELPLNLHSVCLWLLFKSLRPFGHLYAVFDAKKSALLSLRNFYVE